MNKYEITITGWGNEVSVGTITQEEEDRIKEVMENNDCDSIEEFYNDWDLVEEAGVSEWHENDEKFHTYGAIADGATITVTNMVTDEEIFSKPLLDLIVFDDEDSELELWTEEFIQHNDEKIIAFISTDKGTIIAGEIEIEGEFDESKLIPICSEVIIEDSYTFELITNIEYDGEEVDNDGLSTSGKDFTVQIIN